MWKFIILVLRIIRSIWRCSVYSLNNVVAILKLWILKIIWHCRYERDYVKLWRDDRILDSSANTITRLDRTTRVLFQAGTDTGCYLCHCLLSSSGIRLALFWKGSRAIALWVKWPEGDTWSSICIWYRVYIYSNMLEARECSCECEGLFCNWDMKYLVVLIEAVLVSALDAVS